MRYFFAKLLVGIPIRLLLILTVFSIFFFIPHSKAEAFCDSGNNILYCGVNSKGDLLNQMNNGDGVHSGANVRTVLGYFGITTTEVNQDSFTTGSVDKAGTVTDSGGKVIAKGLSWGAGRLPDKCGCSKSFHNIYITPNSSSFIYGSTANVLIATHNGKFRFAIMTGCGNVASANPPNPVQPDTFTISGKVFDDVNHNGTENGSENGVSGVTIKGGGQTAKTNGSGNYTLNNIPAGTHAVTITVPGGWQATTATSRNESVGPDRTNVDFGISRLYTISGTVFNDLNHNGVQDGGEGGASGVTIKGDGKTVTTNGSGAYTITNVLSGTYSISMTVPGGWQATTPTSKNATVGPDKGGIDFGISKLYTVSGLIFNDINKNYKQDGGEPVYTGALTITASRGTVSTSNGTYTVSNLLSGSVTIEYRSLPGDYVMSYPKNGPPPAFAATVGNGCTVDNTTGATCNAGNITNLKFAITNSFPWIQSTCGDMRMDDGISDHLPAGEKAITTDPTCSIPGIAFTGDTDPYLGSGQASTTKQIAGGFSYPEVYASASTISTTYAELLAKAQNANITPTNLGTVCNITNCSLPGNLTHGIYQANGDLTLNASNLPANANYIFLVNGNLTVRGNISVPVGSTALFTTTKDITINANVGSPANSTAQNIDGWYIAGQNFTIDTAGNCADLRLNIGGIVVVNALRTGGVLQNNRDLCGSDPTDPTVSVAQRLDMILNAPNFLRKQVTLSQELAP